MTLLHHMGALHPIETILVLVIAFGPFVALAFVVLHRRRRPTADEAAGPGDEPR